MGKCGRVVFALSETDLYEMVGPSPDHLLLPCAEVFSRTGRHVEVLGPSPELDQRPAPSMRDSGRSSVHETLFGHFHSYSCFMQLLILDKMRWRSGYFLHPGALYREQLYLCQ